MGEVFKDGKPVGRVVEIKWESSAEDVGGGLMRALLEMFDAGIGPITWMDVYLAARPIVPAAVRLETVEDASRQTWELRAGALSGPLVFGFTLEDLAQRGHRVLRDVRRWAKEVAANEEDRQGRRGWSLTGMKVFDTEVMVAGEHAWTAREIPFTFKGEPVRTFEFGGEA